MNPMGEMIMIIKNPTAFSPHLYKGKLIYNTATDLVGVFALSLTGIFKMYALEYCLYFSLFRLSKCAVLNLFSQ